MHPFVTRIAVVVPSLLVQLALLAPGPGVARAVAQGVEESVTGSADFVNTISGNRFRYTVSAIRHQDGSVSGEFENHITNATTGEFVTSAHVSIVCFTITGNIARIGGIVEHVTGGVTPPGAEGFITVVDNGQGESDMPDLASSPGVAPGSALAHCTTGLPRVLFPVEHGNIQIRPSEL
jgi:hypothetical protein